MDLDKFLRDNFGFKQSEEIKSVCEKHDFFSKLEEFVEESTREFFENESDLPDLSEVVDIIEEYQYKMRNLKEKYEK